MNSAKEIVKAIEEMPNGERIKLLEILSKRYYGGDLSQEEIIKLHAKFWEEEKE